MTAAVSNRPVARRGLAGLLLGAAATLGSMVAAEAGIERNTVMAMAAEEPKMPQPPMPEPRDPEIAVREEYDAALRAGTVAALDLFIRRHPGHALAEAARREMERLEAEGKTP